MTEALTSGGLEEDEEPFERVKRICGSVKDVSYDDSDLILVFDSVFGCSPKGVAYNWRVIKIKLVLRGSVLLLILTTVFREIESFGTLF